MLEQTAEGRRALKEAQKRRSAYNAGYEDGLNDMREAIMKIPDFYSLVEDVIDRQDVIDIIDELTTR